MLAAALATMTPFEVIMFGENDETFRAVIKIFWLQIFRHAAKIRGFNSAKHLASTTTTIAGDEEQNSFPSFGVSE